MHRNKLIIIGCGGHAKSVADVALFRDPALDIIFVDDNAKNNERILNYHVVKKYNITNEQVIIAIGDNIKRTTIGQFYYKNLTSIVSSTAYVSTNSKIHNGVFVAHNATIGTLSEIRDFSLINTAASLDHECSIGKGSSVGPNCTLCGNVTVGDNVFIGAGTIIKDKINICDNVIIGAGSIILKNITEPGTYYGNPVKLKRAHIENSLC